MLENIRVSVEKAVEVFCRKKRENLSR